jgi:hypothetical protein
MRRKLTTVALIAATLAPAAATAHAAVAHRPHALPADIKDSDGFTHTFHSENWIHPPIVTMSGRDPDPNASGDIFVNAANSIQSGPMILDPNGQLIWFDPLPNRGAAFDVQVQSYRGQTVLTYYTSTGTDVILNHYYQTVATVQAGNGYSLGLHEFQITPQGTALVTVDKHVPWNLSSVGGPRNGQLVDNAIQEIDIGTGQVLWQWDADQHVRVAASYAGKPSAKTAYDYFHINSIQQLPNGNLLISARHTWAIYEIDKQTGRVLWTLGGKHSNFKLGPGASFEWQHDARMQPDGTITLFDDGAGLYKSEPQSRAIRLRLNFKKHRATLVRAFTNNPPVLSYSQGNVQVLPDGNTFVDFGSAPVFTEFGRKGRQLFSLRFSGPLQTYRAYRFPWWGQPTTPPSIATATTPRGTRVYASWNGATDVAAWRVLAGPTATQLTPAGQFPAVGFETQMWVGTTQPYVAVQALDQHGTVLQTSVPVSR